MGYDNLKLEKELYMTSKSFAEALQTDKIKAETAKINLETENRKKVLQEGVEKFFDV